MKLLGDALRYFGVSLPVLQSGLPIFIDGPSTTPTFAGDFILQTI